MARFVVGVLLLAAGLLPWPAVNMAAQTGAPPAPSNQEAAATLDAIAPPVRAGDLERVRALLDQNPRLATAQDPVGRASLHVAAAADQPAVIALLLERGAVIDARTAEGETPLAVAAVRGAARAARRLLDAGAAVDAANNYGRTPLLLAARESGSADIARALLDRKAAIDVRDKFGDTPLSLAAWKGFREVVDLLLDRGAAVPASGPAAAGLLEFAAGSGLANLFTRLATGGADLSSRTGRGGTMLHLAAAGGSAGIVRELLAKKLGVNDADRDGWTPLHNAAFMGRRDVVEALVAAGADLQARTVLGQSPWNLATEHGLTEVAQWLADNGAGREAPRFPALGGAYLGQKPPGPVPAEFAPGIVGGHFSVHSSVTFSPDGREVYWSESIPPRGAGYSAGRTMVSKRAGDRWTYPERAMVGSLPLEDVPVITADGARIYDMARRLLPGQSAAKENIWVADRTGDRWGDPRPLDQTVNALPQHWQFAVGQDGAVYFSSSWKGARGLFVSRPDGGRYPEPVPLGAPFSAAGNDAMPFLARDGSYLLFGRDYDIYVSFRGATGAWHEPMALPAPINTRDRELCPVVSPDGQYLFFMRAGRVYWVDAAIINQLKAGSSGQEQRPLKPNPGLFAQGGTR